MANIPLSGRHVVRIVITLIACAFASLGGPAGTAWGAKRVAILPAAPGESDAADAPVRAKISKAIKQHKLQVVAPAQVKTALKQAGAPSTDADWMNLARKLKADALVTATASAKGAKRRVEIVVRSGADGATAGQETFAAKGPPKKLAAAVGAGFWKKLGSAFKKTAPPGKAAAGSGLAARDLPPPDDGDLLGEKSSGDGDKTSAGASPTERDAAKSDGDKTTAAAAPSDDDDKDKKATDEGSDDDKDGETDDKSAGAVPAGALRTLEVELDLRFMQRRFSYVPLAAARYYYLKMTPLIGGRVAWFPIQYLGVFAQGEFTNLLKTGIYPTATREFVVGARGRFPVSIAQLGASVAFFQHLFVITDTVAANDTPRTSLPTPDTTYAGVRIALDGRLRLGNRVLVGIEGAYRLVTNPGQGTHLVRSPDYFPNAKVSVAIDGAAFASFAVLDFLELRAGVDYRRYVFGPLQGMNINATAATDDYLAFSLGAVGFFGGK